MAVDLTPLVSDGMQLHIRLNSLLSEYGFFVRVTGDHKLQFDRDVEKLIGQFLPYDE